MPDDGATPSYSPTDVEVHYHFDVPEFWIGEGLIGTSHEVTRGEFTMQLVLPRDGGDFGISDRGPDVRQSAVAGWIEDRERGEPLAMAVTMVRITVSCTLPFGADDVGSGRSPRDDVLEEGWSMLRLGAEAARGLLRDYLELVRTQHGQHWLGLSDSAWRVTWLTEVREKNSGRPVLIGYNDPLGPVHMLSSSDALSFEEHSRVLTQASLGERPALYEALIADAKYLALRSNPPQAREAVLLAAIACEVRIKQALRDACAANALPVLDWALDSPRDVSQQAAGLFDKTAKAVTGRSLREENKAVYNGVDALFQDRNKVAHRGVEIDQAVASRHLANADAALRWAAGLVPERDPDPES